MSARPLFRFVHAANLELDRFCSPSGAMNHDQGRALIDAPFRTTERLFETALRIKADFILLAGKVFSGPYPSTWGASFLARQCERVAETGLQVVWIDASNERERNWPRFLSMPANLHVLAINRQATHRLRTASGVVVDLFTGTTSSAVLSQIPSHSSSETAFRIGVLAKPPAATATLELPVNYWAVLGSEIAQSWSATGGMARSAGTVQPRHAGAGRPGECLSVEVGPGFSLSVSTIESNSVRYYDARCTADDSLSWDSLRRQVHAQVKELLESTPADVVEFNCHVQGHGSVVEKLMQGEGEQLRAELRAAFTQPRPALVVSQPTVTPDAVQESRWQRERSSLGALVRALDALPVGDGSNVDLAHLGLPHGGAIDAEAQTVTRPHFQTRLKAAARRLGAGYLKPRS